MVQAIPPKIPLVRVFSLAFLLYEIYNNVHNVIQEIEDKKN